METPETIKLLGGRLCLDFANSVDWRDVGDPLPHTDALTEPDSLERWARRLRLDEPGAEPLPRAEKPPAGAAGGGPRPPGRAGRSRGRGTRRAARPTRPAATRRAALPQPQAATRRAARP